MKNVVKAFLMIVMMSAAFVGNTYATDEDNAAAAEEPKAEAVTSEESKTETTPAEESKEGTAEEPKAEGTEEEPKPE